MMGQASFVFDLTVQLAQEACKGHHAFGPWTVATFQIDMASFACILKMGTPIFCKFLRTLVVAIGIIAAADHMGWKGQWVFRDWHEVAAVKAIDQPLLCPNRLGRPDRLRRFCL